MKCIDVFNTYSDEYDKWYDSFPYAYESEVAALQPFIPKNKRGVEIGVGTGRFAERLHVECGVEPSKGMAEIARKRGITVHIATGELLPFSNNSFDFALMVTATCFFSDPLKAFKEAYRILVPDGTLTIGMIDKESPLGKIYEENKSQDKFLQFAKLYSVPKVLKWLEDAGFKQEAITQTLTTSPMELTAPEKPQEGYGKGSFVIINCKKHK